jgi:hypothetical protein
MAARLSRFGTESRTSVGTTGASRSQRVRAGTCARTCGGLMVHPRVTSADTQSQRPSLHCQTSV